MIDNRVPGRAYAIRDDEERPCWWITIDNTLFRRASGTQETVRINELTWIAHGRADQELKDLFVKKLLWNPNRPI